MMTLNLVLLFGTAASAYETVVVPGKGCGISTPFSSPEGSPPPFEECTVLDTEEDVENYRSSLPKWEYGLWTPCNATCEGGHMIRNRTCKIGANEVDPLECGGGSQQTVLACNTHVCAEWGSWDGWSCSSSCGSGVDLDTRTCVNSLSAAIIDKQHCKLLSQEGESRQRSCIGLPPCPGWGTWSTYPCSNGNGVGSRVKTRECVSSVDGSTLPPSSCSGSFCEKYDCSGTKSSIAYPQTRFWGNTNAGSVWGTSTAASNDQDCQDDCLNDSECNYSQYISGSCFLFYTTPGNSHWSERVDPPDTLDWSLATGYQFGNGPGECPNATKTCDTYQDLELWRHSFVNWGYIADVANEQACEDKCIAEENCKAALMLTSEPGKCSVITHFAMQEWDSVGGEFTAFVCDWHYKQVITPKP